MIQFRKEFPLAELMALVAHFRGEKKLSFSELLSNMFEVVSYGLGQVVPGPETPKLYGDVVYESTAVADMLESHIQAEPGTVKAAVPWEVIVPALARILTDLVLRYLRGEEK